MGADVSVFSDEIIFGHSNTTGLVAVELVSGSDCPDRMALFVREGDKLLRTDDSFSPFLLIDIKKIATGGIDLASCPVAYTSKPLSGGGELNLQLLFQSWKSCVEAAKWLSNATGAGRGDPSAPFLFINDPARQYLTSSGKTLFKGMELEQVHRMQIDIECITSDGYEFCNAEREGDRIVAIGLSDEAGKVEILSGNELTEKELIKRFFDIVREKDPDVLEGHNIFNFDIPYILTRAKRHGVRPALGRDGSVPRARPSRLPMGERTITYTRYNVFGRHIVDTLFLVQAYDLSERSLDGFGLKEVAVHFGVAAENRTYIEGGDITREYSRDPARVMQYLRGDVSETRAISDMLSPGYLVQSRILPYTYQDVCVRGNATKIDALLIREYLRLEHAIPQPGPARTFEGGYTDMFVSGVVKNVHHCDVRSLYPSIMLNKNIGPGKDDLKVFLRTLDLLTSYRLNAKQQMQASESTDEKHRFNVLQRTFKILINSFYGYLGFSQGQFCDFDAAESVTAEGRSLLKSMITALQKLGAKPVEIDTDGIYFMPPALKGDRAMEEFRKKFALSLPQGIEVEFDGEYDAMFSYKMKNYALLHRDGEVTIKGAALKSRGLEPYQRSFMKEAIRLKLEGKDDALPGLRANYAKSIDQHAWPLAELAKTVTLQDAPATYAAKIEKKARGRDAAYELALKSGRDYRAGDQLSFYITGNKKSAAAHKFAKLLSDADPSLRDENVPYYLAKLDVLCEKLYDTGNSVEGQSEMEF